MINLIQDLPMHCAFYEDKVGQHFQQTLPHSVFDYFPCWSPETSHIGVITSKIGHFKGDCKEDKKKNKKENNNYKDEYEKSS